MSKSNSKRDTRLSRAFSAVAFFQVNLKSQAPLQFFFAVMLISLGFNALAQQPSDKIDPIFRQVIAAETDKNSAVAKSPVSRFRAEPTEGFATKNGMVEKRYECVVYTTTATLLKEKGIFINSVLPTFVTAWVTLEQIKAMSELAIVKYIEAPVYDKLHNDVSVAGTGATLLHQGKLNNTPYKGKNVIVAIFDSGIDWDHFDFRDPADTTKSRILRIWDQTITAGTGEAPPSGFSYGVEYTQTQINDELDGTPANKVRERDFNGHGTHVAGTAAGNGSALPSKKYMGMAPEADLIIIKGGENSFSTARQIDALTYLRNVATTLGKPVVVNMSIGGQTGPHDGTLSNEMAVDNFTSSAPGRAVVISAGNDNGENLHNRFTLGANATTSMSFTVPAGTGGTDVFQYRLYSKDNSAVSATVTAPGGGGTVSAAANQSIGGNVLADSFRVSINNSVETSNNNRYVDVYVSRNGSNTRSPGGTWTLSITNNTAATLNIDGWLNYRSTSFSTTALAGGNSDYLVSSPGNAASAITVGSFAGRNSWYSNAVPGAYRALETRIDSISSFSSRGPRRDEVLKPEITANGQVVVSCLSSNSTSFVPADITEVGLYAKDQGTSMAAPATAGAVALLFQANPGLTTAQVKNYFTITATKDGMTELPGATPNTTWGYGKLDVFKAASFLFNCAPAERRTYKYDSSTRNEQDGGTTYAAERLAVRFTPDINGKLGGTFFHTSLTATALVIEVRANNAGRPGTLLGSVNLDSAAVVRYSWNYVDLSNLNILVASGADYFIVIGRTSTATWSLRSESLAVDGRSMQSVNGGTTWTTINVDYKIRSIVFSNAQSSGALANTNSSDTRNVNTSYQFINSSCALIAQLVSSGVSPVSGNVTGKVWLESTVPVFGGSPYVTRHYEITPVTGASGSSGKVTLYFTQPEFNSFNAHVGSTLDLPASPTDNAGKANLRIGQYPGTSSDNTGLPGSYPGTPKVIDPADGDIVWNAEYSRWEVTFDVLGFSGFLVQTSTTALPLTLEYFRGKTHGGGNVLSWKVICGSSSATFEIERSSDGINFNSIGAVSTNQVRCAEPFDFTDASPLNGANFYRVKIIENNGRAYYTGIVLLQSDRVLLTTVYPTIITKGSAVQVRFSGNKGDFNIIDAAGRSVYRHSLINGTQSLTLPLQSSGVYFYNIKDEKGSVLSGKMVVK